MPWAHGVLANLFRLGPGEIALILLFALLIFGRRIPEIAKNLGKGIVEFKKGLSSTGEEIHQAMQEGEHPEQEAQPKAPAPRQRPVKRIASSDEP